MTLAHSFDEALWFVCSCKAAAGGNVVHAKAVVSGAAENQLLLSSAGQEISRLSEQRPLSCLGKGSFNTLANG
jgi:hypothetical protein